MQQIQDKIFIKGVVFDTESQPLKEFEKEIQETFVTSDFIYNDLKREYLAIWEIQDLKLFLKDIRVFSQGKLESIFDVPKKPIFANWFSGEIVVEREKSHLAKFMKEHDFKKKHHYIFKEGIQKAFYPIDYITKKDTDEEPF